MAAALTASSLPDFDLPPPQAPAAERVVRWLGVALLHGALAYCVVGLSVGKDELQADPTIAVRLLPVAEEKKPEPRPAPVAKALPAAPPVARTPLPVRPEPILAAKNADSPAPFAAAPQPAAPAAKATPAAPAAAEAPVVTAARFDADYLHNPKPVYPPFSRRGGEEGTVLLKVLVSPEGNPLKVDVERSSGYSRLDKAALEAVQKWRFIPAKRGNEAIETSVTVPLTFKIET